MYNMIPSYMYEYYFLDNNTDYIANAISETFLETLSKELDISQTSDQQSK